MATPLSGPQAIPRADARVKVTGLARYPSDIPVANPAFAQLADERDRARLDPVDRTSTRPEPSRACSRS